MSTLGKVDLYNFESNTNTQTTVQRRVDNPPPSVEPTAPDLESPVPGYHIEKEQKSNGTESEEKGNPVEQKGNNAPTEEDNPVAQNEKNYIPDPDANIISKRESIAIIGDNVPSEITSTAARLVDTSIYTDFFKKGKEDRLLEQGMNLVNNSDAKNFFDASFPKTKKGISVNTELIGEYTRTTNTNDYSDILHTTNSARAQAFGVYNNPKKKINAMLFFSGTKTKYYMKADSLIDDVTLDTNTTEEKLSLYGAFKKKCKKDEYNFGARYYGDSLTKTGRIGGSYYLGKWFSSINGYIDWTKIGENPVVNKSRIKVKFLEPKIEQNDVSNEEVPNQTDDNKGTLQDKNVQKWQTSWSPVVDIRTVAGGETTIVGAEFNAIKQKNATTQLGVFMGASTTSDPSEDSQQTYNGNLAVNVDYFKNLGANTTFKAKGSIQNQFTFPFKDNVFVASASARYVAPRISAYGDLKYTLVPDRSYFGAVLGVTGSFTKNLDGFVEASHAVLKEKGESFNTTKISSVMFGARLTF